MSYYGYVERKPEEMQVDWASVTKGISDSLAAWQKGREDLRDKLEKETRETAKAIGETPEVRDEPTQTFVLGAANTAASRLNELNKQLKSNKITPKEYTMRRSNIQSDMNEFYTFVKSFEKSYLAKEQRASEDKSGVVERVVTEKALKKLDGGLGGLKPEVDETGTLIFKSEDGKTSTSMREMMKLGSFQYNKKNSLDEMMKLGKQMAAVQKGLISSSRVNDEAMNTINRQIDAILLNPNDIADVLDDAGVKRDWEVDDFKVVITDEDKEMARGILRDAALSSMGVNIEKAPSGGSTGSTKSKELTQGEKNALYFGQALRDPTKKANAALIAKELGVANVEYNGTTLTITNKDNSKTTQNITPDELPGILISMSGLDQQYANQGLGGATKMGAFSGGGGVGKKPAVGIEMVAGESGDVPTPTQIYNFVIDAQIKNPDYKKDFEYKDGKARVAYKDDKGIKRWHSAGTVGQLNDAIRNWNQQNAR